MTSVLSTWMVCSRTCDPQRPEAEGEIDRKARPATAQGELLGGHPGQALDRGVDDGAEAVTDLGRAADGLVVLLGQVGPDVVGGSFGQRRVVRSPALAEPPRGADAVRALAADDVAHRGPDGPFVATRVGVPRGVRERREKSLQVPARRGRRGHEVGGATAGDAGGPKSVVGFDAGQLQPLGDAVGAVAKPSSLPPVQPHIRVRASSGMVSRARAAAAMSACAASRAGASGALARPRSSARTGLRWPRTTWPKPSGCARGLRCGHERPARGPVHPPGPDPHRPAAAGRCVRRLRDHR